MYSAIKNRVISEGKILLKNRFENIYLKENFKVSKNTDFIKLDNDRFNLSLRRQGSDWEVFSQIFMHHEYKPVSKALGLNNINPKLILDLGANIGLTTAYLKDIYPDCEIICLEPDRNNFEQLRENTKNLTNIKRLNAAVWHRSSKLEEINDEPSIIIEDWGKSFREQTNESSNTIQGFTISEILVQSSHQFIDLLKIDIEGAERFIFNKEISDLNFLKITRCIAIEIHDEFDIREEINQILNEYNFALFEAGELTIGIKK